MDKQEKKTNQIIIYNTQDGQTKIAVKMEDETVWLSQKQMAALLDCSVDNIALHLKNVYSEGKLAENSTSEDSLVVQKEGEREVNRTVKIYNLDAIISVGYRVNSLRGTQFRIWAMQKLREKIIHFCRLTTFFGYAIFKLLKPPVLIPSNRNTAGF